ncbi:MAG: hypothetical protein ABSF81_18280 [Bacteroidales bacterium]
MKRVICFIFISLSFLYFLTYCKSENTLVKTSEKTCNTITFNSSDSDLNKVFMWAKNQALAYAFTGDPVGQWCEATLPGRKAFCMRDVSHQCIGAEILGLNQENKNMFTKFVSNISESKKWCSYWEINKWDKPAPVDYENDNDFWYNLNANFDVIYACWRLYNWTGNKTYINDPVFLNFYSKSLNEYIHKWKLEPDSLLNRPELLNVDPNLTNRMFTHGYGLASYAEDVPGLTMSTDLISAIYQGYISYSEILNNNGKADESKLNSQKAEEYSQILNTKWWDPAANLYNTYYTRDGNFGKGEGEAYLLWFDILKDLNKINYTINNLTSKTWNVENMSYFPYLLYKNGYWDKAYEYLLYCSNPATERREYPEVSFGVIEGIVQGLMGVTPDAVTRMIRTLHRTNREVTSELKNLPVLGTSINIIHTGTTKSSMSNNGNKSITWQAMFRGKYSKAQAGNKFMTTKTEKDKQGYDISYVDILLAPGKQIEVTVF